MKYVTCDVWCKIHHTVYTIVLVEGNYCKFRFLSFKSLQRCVPGIGMYFGCIETFKKAIPLVKCLQGNEHNYNQCVIVL